MVTDGGANSYQNTPPDYDNSAAMSMTSSSSTATSSVKFVPNQLNNHPIAKVVRPASNLPPVPPSVIQSGPTLYKQTTKSSKTDTKKDKSPPPVAQIPMKTMALPADVELLAAKKQASVAYENSYLGQVLRGEKKMKRFVRTSGGQVIYFF